VTISGRYWPFYKKHFSNTRFKTEKIGNRYLFPGANLATVLAKLATKRTLWHLNAILWQPDGLNLATNSIDWQQTS